MIAPRRYTPDFEELFELNAEAIARIHFMDEEYSCALNDASRALMNLDEQRLSMDPPQVQTQLAAIRDRLELLIARSDPVLEEELRWHV